MSEDEFGLTVAVVSYNSYNAICACMDELLGSNVFRVIVVDNASSDNSGARLKERYPGITLIQSDTNLGYGRAANLALRVTSTRYFLLVNPDLKAGLDAVGSLFRHMLALNGNIAVLAPAVKRSDFKNAGLLDRKWVIGAAMMFDKRLLDKVGYFDENIFLFSEETDLCYRIKQAGMSIVLDSDVYIEHLYRQSSTPDPRIDYLKNWHFSWSRMYFYKKHGLAKRKKNPFRMIAVYALKTLVATNAEKRNAYRARMRGALAFVRGESAFLANGKPQAAF